MSEDLWNAEVETTEVPETTPDSWMSDLDNLISEIASTNNKSEPENPTEPTNFVQNVKDSLNPEEPVEPETPVEPEVKTPVEPEKPTAPESNDSQLTEQEAKELDEAFTEMEWKFETLESDMNELQTLSTWYEDALTKLWSHPVLWPLNEKLLNGEEINIPEFLQKSHDEELAAMPSLDKTNPVSKEAVPKASLQDRLVKNAGQMY